MLNVNMLCTYAIKLFRGNMKNKNYFFNNMWNAWFDEKHNILRNMSYIAVMLNVSPLCTLYVITK